MIVQSQLTPAVHCVLSTPKNMLPFVVTNNNVEKYVIPLTAMLTLKTKYLMTMLYKAFGLFFF
jgi:hypothetical protein